MGFALLYLTLVITVLFQEEAAPLAGALAARHGHGSLALVIAACAAGSWAGDLALFGIGRRGGRLARRPLLAKPLALIAKHPRAAPLAVRFAYGMRFTLPIACGAAGVPPRSFAMWAAVSAALWATAFSAFGWGAGELTQRLFSDVRHYEIAAIVVIAVLWLTVVALLHLRESHNDVRAADSAAGA